MRWLRKLYLGEKAAPNAKKLIRAAERGKKGKQDDCCLIVLSTYPAGELDLMSFSESRGKIYQNQVLSVIGLAADKKEAVSMLEQLSRDCLEKSGAIRLKEYFSAGEFVNWREVSVSQA